MSLATINRPKSFDEVLGQEMTIKILKRQIDLKQYANCYLFCGPTGVGKTTIARILANNINNNLGDPIEIDAASNNGVDNIRNIISSSNERSLNSEYKIFIIDECHMITTAGWNAFLKCIEEPPRYTIFIFCTTDPQKIPATISNRMMRFNLTRVNSELIRNKLVTICNNINLTFDDASIDYIVKIANGSVRNAIVNLEKVISFSNEIILNNTLAVLNDYSYDVYFNLINAIIDNKQNAIIEQIEYVYDGGNDLKLFLDQLIDFTLNLTKFTIFKDMSIVNLPDSLEDQVIYTTGVFDTQEKNIKYFTTLTNKLFDIKADLRYDINVKTSLETVLLSLTIN